eukprot:TRINITY_DN4700_c0_g1_i1.p4 TRINITY_DN4700_c0_g1~~TRINITY_DN4700_c0_g1_i1.p4  ORF type:complete len:61 (+),score=5.10 TRINITY_DN4700_c0_g1_i1:948-1130(+)
MTTVRLGKINGHKITWASCSGKLVAVVTGKGDTYAWGKGISRPTLLRTEKKGAKSFQQPW